MCKNCVKIVSKNATKNTSDNFINKQEHYYIVTGYKNLLISKLLTAYTNMM